MQTFQKPAKRYYGWNIVTALAITETISWGIIYYAFSVFITATEAEMGWTRTEITGAFSLALLVTGVMAFPIGTWIDRHGARLLMTLGSVMASILIIAWSQIQTLPALYLVWVGLGICASMLWYEPAFTVVAMWFVQRRTQALAIITFAAGLASTIFIPLSDTLLHLVGWRDAIFLLGILLGITTIPLHALVLRHRPQTIGLLPDGESHADSDNSSQKTMGMSLRDALHSPSFWWLALAFGFAHLASSAIRFHLIPYLTERGVTATTAAFASGSVGIMQVAGRIVFAPLDKRLSIQLMVGSVFALQALSLLIVLMGASGFAIAIFIILFGAAYGAQTLARPAIMAEIYGSTHYGRISSVMVIFLTLAGTIAPVGTSWLYDQLGTYQPIIVACIIIFLLATFFIYRVKLMPTNTPLSLNHLEP